MCKYYFLVLKSSITLFELIYYRKEDEKINNRRLQTYISITICY